MVSHLTLRKNLKKIKIKIKTLQRTTHSVWTSWMSTLVSWVPRRSDVLTRIAEDLTHTDFASTLALDRHADTTTLQSFPPPISGWMRRPEEERDLGHKVIAWYKGLF